MIRYIILFTLLFILSCSKEEDTLLEDMAFLDKQYIETILVVKNMNKTASDSAISNFIVFWDLFKDRYYNLNAEDRQWQSDFDAMQDILISSRYYVLSGEDISASYSILHDGKYVLSDMRKRNNIDWFIDDINSVYKTAIRIRELTIPYSNNDELYTLLEGEIIRIVTVFELLVFAIEKVMLDIDESNVYLFKIPDNNLSIIIQNINTMSDIIIDIEYAIANNNYEDVVLHSDSIINIYFNILSLIVLE